MESSSTSVAADRKTIFMTGTRGSCCKEDLGETEAGEACNTEDSGSELTLISSGVIKYDPVGTVGTKVESKVFRGDLLGTESPDPEHFDERGCF